MNEELKMETSTEVKPTIDKGLTKELLKNASPAEGLEVAKKENKEAVEAKKISLKEKILNAFKASPEKLLQKGQARMEANPKIKAMYAEVQKTDPERAEKLKMALGKYEYAKWDDNKKDYVDAAIYTEHVNK